MTLQPVVCPCCLSRGFCVARVGQQGVTLLVRIVVPHVQVWQGCSDVTIVA